MKHILLLIVFILYGSYSFADGGLIIDYGGDALTEKERQRIERMMDYQIDFYSMFGLKDSLRVRLTVFDERSEGVFYLDTIGVSKYHSLKNVNALYMHNRKEAVILGMDEDRKRMLPVIYHELSHYFTREITDINPPMWLMEGLSEYFENCEVGKKGIKHSITSYEKGRIRTMYMLGEIDLRKFVDSDRSLFMKKQRTDEQSAYILSHSLVTFMIENVSRQVFVDLINLLHDNTDKSKISEKIARVYPGGFDAFENDYAKLYNKP